MDENSKSLKKIKIRLIMSLFQGHQGFESRIIGLSFIKMLNKKIDHMLDEEIDSFGSL